MLLLVDNMHEKSIPKKSQDRQNFDSARYLLFKLVLQLCTLVT